MTKQKLAKELVKLASELSASSESEDEIGIKKMASNYRQVLASKLVEGFEKRDYITAEEMETFCKPCAAKMREKKMSKISKQAFFKRQADMTWEECIEEAKKTKNDPEAFCGWLRYYGPHGIKK